VDGGEKNNFSLLLWDYLVNLPEEAELVTDFINDGKG
jgi:hypothetical protein